MSVPVVDEGLEDNEGAFAESDDEGIGASFRVLRLFFNGNLLSSPKGSIMKVDYIEEEGRV